MNTIFRFAVLPFLLMCSISLVAQDAESDFVKVSERKDWGFSISPYAWLAGMSTDVGGEKLRQSFNDLSSITNFGFQMSASARYKRLILSFDGTYAALGSEMGSEFVNVDVSINQWIIDPKLGYLFYDDIHYDEDEVIAGWSIEGNLGAKYWLNDIGVNYTLGIGDNPPIAEGEIKESQQWWDLMMGVKTRIVLSKRVLLGVAANIGGFGLGNSSKISWDFTYTNTFRVSNLILITAGYRTFKYKRIDGEGAEALETKVSAFGPMLGVSFVL
jgi:hypothetical protein